MTDIDIKNLQSENRFPDVGLNYIYLLVYWPIGLVLLVFRLIIGILIWILGAILPDISITRSLLTTLFCLFFGIVVKVEKIYNKKNVKVIISNQVSPLDHLAIHYVTNSILPCSTTLYSPLSHSMGVNNITSNNIDELKKSISSYLINSSFPILFQPENKITTGKSILKFKDWPFSFSNEVQPIFIKVHRPFLNASVTTIESNFWNDIFWYLFLPVTIYEIYFLGTTEKGELNDNEFGDLVRENMAREMKITLCSFSSNDVTEWEKRYLMEQRRARMVHGPSSSMSGSIINPEVQRMARQVKEVLPAVPSNVIIKDLLRTKNVDITITNILEGHIQYVPETIPTPTVVQTPSPSYVSNKTFVSKEITGNDFCTAAPSFPKSAQERMQSFQERKLQLIMNARKRYMDKHGLNALASNDC